MKHFFFVLFIALIFTSCLSAFYVANTTDFTILVTTKNNYLYVLKHWKSQMLQASDYPITIKYKHSDKPIFVIKAAGCDSISGGGLDLHHANLCPK